MENFRVWKKDVYEALFCQNGKSIPYTDIHGIPTQISFYDLYQAFSKVPSAEGYPACWLRRTDENGEVYLQCGRCGRRVYETENRKTGENIKFCPYCGAECKM